MKVRALTMTLRDLMDVYIKREDTGRNRRGNSGLFYQLTPGNVEHI